MCFLLATPHTIHICLFIEGLLFETMKWHQPKINQLNAYWNVWKQTRGWTQFLNTSLSLVWHLNLYFVICFVFPVWENRMSRVGKNACTAPSNCLDWDGIASLFKSNGRGWAFNNTYYTPLPLTTTPRHLWFVLGLFASSNPSATSVMKIMLKSWL